MSGTGLEELRPVGHEHRDPVTGLDAPLGEPGRRQLHPLVQRGPADRLTLETQCDLIGDGVRVPGDMIDPVKSAVRQPMWRHRRPP